MKKIYCKIALLLVLVSIVFLPFKRTEAKSESDLSTAMNELFDVVNDIIEKYSRMKKDACLLAELIYWENWYTDAERKTARWTGAVVMNRVESEEFPDSVEGVIYQTKPCKQYAVTGKFFTKELPREAYDMAWDILINGTPEVPKNVLYQATFPQGKGEWKRLNGEVFCYG